MISIGAPQNLINITITKNDLSCFGRGDEGWALASVTGGLQPYTYKWSTIPAQFTDKASDLGWGYYYVDVVDANGCKVKDTVYIDPGPCCEQVFIPNAFSPNGDGKNDVFRITTSTGIKLYRFEIYNRWGNKVWSTIDPKRGWDGTQAGGESEMGTYYYIFSYMCITDGQDYLKKGDVILVK
jgi:gliding motility-associated-like protein